MRRGCSRGLSGLLAGVLALAPAVPAVASSGGPSASNPPSTGAGDPVPSVNRLVNDQLVLADLNSSGLPSTARLINRLVSVDMPPQTIKQTTATDDVRYVDRAGAPSIQGDGIVLNVGGAGSQTVTTQANFNKPLPVALHAEYLRNGVAVDPDDLTGMGGVVTIKYTVTNTVLRKETISYKDANGNMMSEEQPVFAPFAGAMRVTLPQGMRLIAAPDAVSNTAKDGQTELQWNLTLYPPMASYNQVVELTVSADSIQLPDVLMEVTPITSNQDPATGFASNMLDESVKGNAELADGLEKLDKSAAQLANGAAELASGLEKLSRGTSELASGQKQLSSGTTKADRASSKLASASRLLTAGLGEIASGLADLSGASGLPSALALTLRLQVAVQAIVTGVGAGSDPPIPWPPDPSKITLVQATRATQKGALALKAAVELIATALATSISDVGTIKTTAEAVETDANTAVTEANAAYTSFGCPATPSTAACTDLQDAINAATDAKSGAATIQTSAGSTADSLTLQKTALAGDEFSVSAGLTVMSNVLTKITDGLIEVSTALKSGDPDNPGVYEGLDLLREGLEEAVSGALALSVGADGAEAGSAVITSGQAALTTGLDSLAIGAKESAAGAAEVNSGAQDAASGSNELSRGAREMQTQGTHQIFTKIVDASKQPALAQAYYQAATKLADSSTPYEPPDNARGRIAYVYTLNPPRPMPAVDWPLVILAALAAIAVGIMVTARIRRPLPSEEGDGPR